MTTYFDTSTLPFRPAIKIKPLARVWNSDFSTWFVKGRVVTRACHYGHKPGDVVYSRASELYAFQGVQRGKCGRLYWSDRMPDAELMALPVERTE